MIEERFLNIKFLPSLDEIENSELSNAYMAGIYEFDKSLQQLYNSVLELDNVEIYRLQIETSTLRRFGKTVHRHAPKEYIEWLITLMSGAGGSVAFYKLLKLWVDSRNGRKIRIKIGDVEVETSQMSAQDVKSLVAEVLEMKELKEEGIIIKYRDRGLINSEKFKEEDAALRKKVRESKIKAKDKLSKRLDKSTPESIIRLTSENITQWPKYDALLKENKIKFDSVGRLRYLHGAPVGDLTLVRTKEDGTPIYQELATEWFDPDSATAREFIWP